MGHMVAPPSALTEFPGHGLPELKDGAESSGRLRHLEFAG